MWCAGCREEGIHAPSRLVRRRWPSRPNPRYEIDQWSGDGHLVGALGGNINDKKGKIFVVLESALAPSAKPTYLLFPLDPKQG